MEHKTVDNIDNLSEFINSMEVNVYYNLPSNWRYKWVKVEKSNNYYTKEVEYHWAMEMNYKTSGCVGYVYPLVGNNMVKHFKTEKGAKRNLEKNLQWHFDSILALKNQQ